MKTRENVRSVSFGCRLNSHESAIMQARAEAAGFTDTIIVNTCAVTAQADRQARQAIRRLHRENPGATLLVTGCASHLDPQTYKNLPGVAEVIANNEKLSLGMEARPGKKPRGTVQVQNGCDHRCTFCIIPYGRGASTSLSSGDIIAQLQILVDQGVNEVVFTGVDIASYGKDLSDSPRLGDMAQDALKKLPGLPRLRFSSLDPAAMDPALWELFEHEPRVMPHLHLSVQAGDDMVLKRMKRRHSRADLLKIAARVHGFSRHIGLGADLIAGFPTETDAMFQNTSKLVDEAGLTWLHVFPYSARMGTPAAKMPQVPSEKRLARAAALRQQGQAAVERLLSGMIGTRQEVLIEKNENGKALGRAGNYAEVVFDTDLPAGALATVHITARAGDKAAGAFESMRKAA